MRQRPSPTLGAWQAALPCWSGSQGRQTAGGGLGENCRDILAGKLAEPCTSRAAERKMVLKPKNFNPFKQLRRTFYKLAAAAAASSQPRNCDRPYPANVFPFRCDCANAHENRQSPPAELTRPRGFCFSNCPHR